MQKKFIPFKRIAVASCLILLFGCGGVEEDMAASSLEQSLGQGPGWGGPFAHKLQKALSEVGLRTDQKNALENLRLKIVAETATMRKARSDLFAELAQQIRRGALDESRLSALKGAIEKEMTADRPVFVSALNALHNTLDAAQRQKLVDNLKPQRPWMGRGRQHFVEKLQKEIGLTDEQMGQIRDTIKAQMKQHRNELRGKMGKMRGELKAAAEAFVSDSFDAAKIPLLAQGHQMMGNHMDKMIAVGKQVLPILTPEQREKLATLLEQRAKHMDEAK
jgi:Spy/CpxP family protein refolding chaperone